MAKTFPKQVYVTIQDDGTDWYLVADKDVPVADESQRCAIYELKEVGIVSVTRSFEKGKR